MAAFDSSPILQAGMHWQWNPDVQLYECVQDGTFKIFAKQPIKACKQPPGWYRELE